VQSFGLGTTAAGRQPTGRGKRDARTILQAQQWIAGSAAASRMGQREYLPLMMPAAADGDDDGVGAAGDRVVDSSAQDFAER
jgi:hypothetical protein